MTAIVDSLFPPHDAIHANGDRHGFRPGRVRWRRTNQWETGIGLYPHGVWWTDGHVPEARYPGKQIGLLLEPPDIHPENYAAAGCAFEDGNLDYIFTHQPQEFEGAEDRAIVYPLGGTMIHESDWRIDEEKQPIVSAIASDKRGLPGHALRHDVIQKFQGHPGFVPFGPSYTPIPLNSAGYYRKVLALQDVAFSLAIECVDTGLILSEHVLDCFLTGTIPIYWGPPDALRYWGFDLLGVLQAHDLKGLTYWTGRALEQGMRLYEERIGAIERNFIRAHEFTCPEDWLYRNYPELFDE